MVTHGDGLSLASRARVCAYLGEVLGIPPTKQIFDIPGDAFWMSHFNFWCYFMQKFSDILHVFADTGDSVSELAMMDMLRYSLEHADRNLPLKFKTLVSLEVRFLSLFWHTDIGQVLYS